ncbi:MAG: biotin--[acetyl-CoA-carboxylase] ligase [Acutalibacteraceae bacterium]|nr:biotin--[acetyl-CoA-carboxylase] ligase [Acutalibacteraceae bacterium]
MITIKPKIPFKIYTFDSVDSTNNICKELALKGEKTAIVIADSQTQGKGRLGRSFFSPQRTGIYMSLLLRPDISPKDCNLITTAAAVAVSDAIDTISGKNTLIKWVNDIYLDGKKICGILCESGFSNNDGALDYVILGIGINLFTPENSFPDELKDIASSVFTKSVNDSDIKRKLIEEIINNFLLIYNRLPDKEYMKRYREKSFLTGKTVSFEKNGVQCTGVVADIDDDAKIIIQTSSETVTLFAGEVTLKF